MITVLPGRIYGELEIRGKGVNILMCTVWTIFNYVKYICYIKYVIYFFSTREKENLITMDSKILMYLYLYVVHRDANCEITKKHYIVAGKLGRNSDITQEVSWSPGLYPMRGYIHLILQPKWKFWSKVVFKLLYVEKCKTLIHRNNMLKVDIDL